MSPLLAVMAATLFLGLGSCTDHRSFDQTQGKPRDYLDQDDPSVRAAAAANLSESILKGTQDYRLSPGDIVQILYSVNHDPVVRDYRIGVGDEIEVAFAREPDLAHNYVIRPDGRFDLPEHGTIVAARKRPEDLAREIAGRFADTLVSPSVTVNVRRFTSNADELVAMISGGTAPRAEAVTIGPDGTLTPPMLMAIHAVGRTTDELAGIINHAYSERVANVTTTVRLNSVGNQQVFVFGEVQRPGPISSARGRSVLQLVGAAGGPTEFAAMTAVRVLYWDEAGQAHIRQANLMAELDKLDLDEDMVVPTNAIVYVPPTALAKAGRFMDQLLRRVFLYQGSSLGVQFGSVGTSR
jgi:polysaccharide export outer membrane protein